MADFKTVMDKLHSFISADDIAEFFRGYGIKAEPQNARACAISKFVEMEVGAPVGNILTTTETVTLNERCWDGDYEYDATVDVVSHTDAMRHFVKEFDRGTYPDLVVDGWIFESGDYDCNCNICQGY